MSKIRIIYFLTFFSGFLCLAQEILWMRLISFVGMSVPQAFSYTLALFLFGIAVGAHIGKKICHNYNDLKIKLLGYILLAAGVVDSFLFLFIYILSHYWNSSILFLGICVLVSAGIRGIIFPLVHHVGTQQFKSGSQISNVYFCNVIGSALAPLCISFIALEYLNTQQVYLCVCFITILISIFFVTNKLLKCFTLIFLFSLGWALTLPEKLLFEFSKNSYKVNQYPVKLLENKHGVIQVYEDEDEQVVFGANVYDGKFNTNLLHNSNGIDRAYLLTVLKPEIENILVIGLSTGSWVKVLSTIPSVKKITIVEINPAYIELIKSDPLVSDLLKDDRIEIIFDDGRKWVKKNQDQKFDLVLMNTTWHWRAYVSNLLSKDFLSLLENILEKDGFVFYNTTRSIDAFYTAKYVFPNVYQYKFMVLASNNSIIFPDENIISERLCTLENYLDKQNVFTHKNICDLGARAILDTKLVPFDSIEFLKMSSRQPELITDNNMISEYKFGKGL